MLNLTRDPTILALARQKALKEFLLSSHRSPVVCRDLFYDRHVGRWLDVRPHDGRRSTKVLYISAAKARIQPTKRFAVYKLKLITLALQKVRLLPQKE
jgi:hypothetical protein